MMDKKKCSNCGKEFNCLGVGCYKGSPDKCLCTCYICDRINSNMGWVDAYLNFNLFTDCYSLQEEAIMDKALHNL